MNIADLKTGMIVEVRNGDRYLLLKSFSCQYDHISDCMVNISHPYSWLRIKDYDNNLVYIFEDDEYDIMKVFRVKHPYNIVAHGRFMEEYDMNNPNKSDDNKLELFWERPPIAKKDE